MKACFHKPIQIFDVIACLHASEKAKLLSCNVQTLVEMERFELLTPCLQGRCSPN